MIYEYNELKKTITTFSFYYYSCPWFQLQSGRKNKEPIEPISAASAAPPTRKLADSSKLIGDWVRTDAPYEIKISEMSGNGVMKVGYFNPRSINVSKASWSPANGAINIYIELRDVNYPGSNYNLTYFAGSDTLVGKYFQAVEGVTYDVGFSRKK